MAMKLELPEPDMRGKKPKMQTFISEPDMSKGSKDKANMLRNAKRAALAKRSLGKGY
jgi:hypothetical protein